MMGLKNNLFTPLISMKMLSCLLIFLGLNTASADVKQGEQVFAKMCVACHAHNLQGGIGPSLVDAYWKHGDSKAEISKVISDGIYDSNMIAFKNVLSEGDRKSLVEFILSRQAGLRSVSRKAYKLGPGVSLTLENLKNKKLLKGFKHPENVIYFDGNPASVIHVQAKLYIKEAADYKLHLHQKGQSRLYIDGKELAHFQSKGKEKHSSEAFKLKPGVYELDLLHQKPEKGWFSINGQLKSSRGSINLFGESMKGATPKMMVGIGRAKIIRKKINKLSPRSVLVLLPNQALIAFNPLMGGIEKAWQSAKIDLTPSIKGRGGANSNVHGKEIGRLLTSVRLKDDEGRIQYLAAQIQGASAIIELRIDGAFFTFTLSPAGSGYKLLVQTNEDISALELELGKKVKLNGKANSGKVSLNGSTAKSFILELENK